MRLALFERHRAMAERIARGFARVYPNLADDIMQAALIALWNATEMGERKDFGPLARGRIKWAALDEIRARLWFHRDHVDAVMEYRIPEELAHEPDHRDPLASLTFCVAVEWLTWQEYQVVHDHYLMDLDLQDIAADLGVTPARVSRIHRNALEKFRERLRVNGA